MCKYMYLFSHKPSLRKKEEPKRLLRGTVFLSGEQTPLWHCFGSSFLSGAVFLKKIFGMLRGFVFENGSPLPGGTVFFLNMIMKEKMAPL